MFGKLLQLLHASNKYGLALVFLGAVFYLNRSLGFLPFHLSEAQAEWVTVAALLGARMLVADFIVWLCSLAGKGWRALRHWWEARTVMNRLDESLQPASNLHFIGLPITKVKTSAAVATLIPPAPLQKGVLDCD